MNDLVTIDQLRTFIAVVDEGTFSAAGRRLSRTQSAISYTLASLETQLAIQLFDRNGRIPVLTRQGSALIAEARAVMGSMDLFRGHAKSLASGLEAELSVVIDARFPVSALTAAAGEFQAEFPATRLQLHVRAPEATLQPILEKRGAFGIIVTLERSSTELIQERLADVQMLTIAAGLHPLATHSKPIPMQIAERYTQIVLADSSTRPREIACEGPAAKTWQVGDLATKHAFLKAGLGWGNMPRDSIGADLEAGLLVPLSIDGTNEDDTLPMSAIYLAARPPGQAGRWLIDRLQQ